MWAIKNHTPYKAAKGWGRDKEGVHEWIVCVKGTFDITRDGGTKIADEQLDPLAIPEYHGEPGRSSLRYDADLVGPKPTTDVILNGTAYAPRGRPSTDFNVGLTLGSIRKTLRVRGQRSWEDSVVGPISSNYRPVIQLPITYERAYGGFDQTDPDPRHQRMDSRNPVGCGVVASPRHRVGQPLPNFEYPNGDVDKKGPAGFGAIDSFWSPRRELAGVYDDRWRQTRYPLLPSDWDPKFHLCSPPDQRPVTFLKGSEPVELTNLTPNGLLRFTLPQLRFAFSTVFSTAFGHRRTDHVGQLASVILEPDYPRVILVWISVLSCPVDGDYLEHTIVTEVNQ